ncbi:MAG: putative bifunctional diguanylate cyclase/phosphodiesterase [Acidimicrobiia bacterium]
MIEDDQDDYAITVDLLAKARLSFEVDWVASYADGIEAIRRDEHDIYLVDYRLDAGDGLDLLREAGEKPSRKPFIFLTGLGDEQVAMEAMQLGAADYLEKGRIDTPLIERTIRYAIERFKALEAVRESEQRYALAMAGANDGLWDWDLKAKKVFFSPRWKEILGYGEPDIGDDIEEWFRLIHEADLPSVKKKLEDHLEDRTSHFESEHRIRHADGHYLWVLVRGLAVRDQNGQAYRMAGSLTDISHLKQARGQILHDTFHDRLTQMPNRALFMDRLATAAARTSADENYISAVLVLNLDKFRTINERFSHEVGDKLLVECAARLRRPVRTTDTIARLGADEFAVLLENVKDATYATRVADRLQETLADPFELNGEVVEISAAIGIALTGGGESAEKTLHNAYMALSQAKGSGGGSAVFDAALQARVLFRLGLESELSGAIERNELRALYQPIVTISTREVLGFEALLRWERQDGQVLSPESFTSLAEEMGLIKSIDLWVMREACRQLREWDREGYGNPQVYVSVNLAASHFAGAHLASQVRSILEETSTPPHRLRLEITETSLVQDVEAAERAIRELDAEGVQVMVDDFGTGYSTLAYLQNLSIKGLKIDRSFINRLASDEKSADIVRTVLALARDMNMYAVAEGVETSQQSAMLSALGCEYGQGYLFSRPVGGREAWTALDPLLPAAEN